MEEKGGPEIDAKLEPVTGEIASVRLYPRALR